MNITFIPLTSSHFDLLLKWLEAPHVKKFWDSHIKYTDILIKEKYSSYVEGYKLSGGIKKPIFPYIICQDETPVGYIQVYNAYDFPRAKPLERLPLNLAALDLFIGEEHALGLGIASKAIEQFCIDYLKNSYDYIFVDTDISNMVARRAYEKAGFKEIVKHEDTKEIWMLKKI